MRIRRVVQLSEESIGLVSCEAGTGKTRLPAEVLRMMRSGRDVSVNVAEVPVRASEEGG